jgi:signal transduction histidine kinase
LVAGAGTGPASDVVAVIPGADALGGHLATVSVVATDRFDDGVPRRPVPAAFSERQWLATVVLAACAGLTMVALAVGPYPHGGALRLLLAVVACAPIVWLRRWPLPVLAVAAVASGLFMAASGNASLPLAAMAGLAVYFVASRLPRRVSVPAAVAAAAALGAALLYAVLAVRTAAPAAAAVAGLLPLVAAWFTGDSVAARRRYVAGLTEQERTAEAERAGRQIREERVRIARELHDVVANPLCATVASRCPLIQAYRTVDPAHRRPACSA